jgi:hypothetical protein
MPSKYQPKTNSKMTPEQRARISAAVKKRYADPEERAKTAAKLKEVNGTPEARAAIAEKTRAYHARAKAAMDRLAQIEAEADRG